MNFDPRTIRSFVTLADLLSFTKAAEQLGVTQPHLSARIKSLEQQLGFALFSRSSRRVEITPGGRAFLEAAEAFLAEALALERVAHNVRNGRATSIRLGAGSCHVDIRWSLLEQFMREYPHIEVSVRVYQNAAEISAALRSGDGDVALVVPPVPDEFDFLRRTRATAGLIARRDSVFAREERVDPSVLAGQQLAIFPRHVFPALFDSVIERFKDCGAWFSELPDTGAACVSSFVRATGVPAIAAPWWTSDDDRPADIVCRFVEGHVISLDSILMRSRTRSSEAVSQLWRRAEKMSVAKALGAPSFVSRPFCPVDKPFAARTDAALAELSISQAH